MVLVFKKRGRWVFIALVVSFFVVVLNLKHLPIDNKFAFPLIFAFAALLNFLFTIVFLRKEVEWTDEEFQQILEQLKERHPKRKWGSELTKFEKLNYSNCSSLFFIRNKNWTWIYLGLAILLLIFYFFYPVS
ncbi:MAG: hypothetical protein LBV19_08580 [Streptococcaceae bacterium]|jgi:hypothetical protein|nr:hypothetical protein [Streptococcaceae bacterium]